MKSIPCGLAERLLVAGSAVGSLAIWLIAAIVSWDVVLRFLGRPTLWALEVSGYLLVAAAVLASGLSVLRDGHFSVRLLPEALGERARSGLGKVIHLACAGLLAFTAYGVAQLMGYSIAYDVTSPTLLHIPLYWPQSVMLAGFVLMIVGFILKLVGKQ